MRRANVRGRMVSVAVLWGGLISAQNAAVAQTVSGDLTPPESTPGASCSASPAPLNGSHCCQPVAGDFDPAFSTRSQRLHFSGSGRRGPVSMSSEGERTYWLEGALVGGLGSVFIMWLAIRIETKGEVTAPSPGIVVAVGLPGTVIGAIVGSAYKKSPEQRSRPAHGSSRQIHPSRRARLGLDASPFRPIAGDRPLCAARLRCGSARLAFEHSPISLPRLHCFSPSRKGV